MLKIIAAVAENRIIGIDGGLPWKLPDDMKWFKNHTGTDPVVMGRKTFNSLPDRFRPLPNRLNIIMSRHPWPEGERPGANVVVVNDFQEVIERSKDEDVWVIGGADIYALALSDALEMYLTRVHTIATGNVLFPLWDTDNWLNVSAERHEADENHQYPFTWEVYRRKS